MSPQRPVSHNAKPERPRVKWKPKEGTTTERGYGHAWRKLREQVLKRDCYLCQPCKRAGRIAEAKEVDHIQPKSAGGTDAVSNLQAICKPCHLLKSDSESGVQAAAVPTFTRKPLIPVTVVCGPPGSGKTSWVAARAQASDLVLDLDEIQARLSGLGWYGYGEEWIQPALAERNRRLGALANPSNYTRCWLIVGAPTWSERRKWKDMLGADVVVLEVDEDECLSRIGRDTRRPKGKHWEPAVRSWWQRHSSGRDETVVRG